jgi:hypothetical protein
MSPAVVGRSPEELSLAERRALAGHWIALEIYTPQNLALRRIEAIGATREACLAALAARGLEARRFELELLRPPY